MISVLDIQNHVQNLEKHQKTDFVFVLCEDGSGSFEKFYTTKCWQYFNNFKELEVIITTGNLSKIKIK